MIRARRAKLVLFVLAVELVALGVWAWEPAWNWVTAHRVYLQTGEEERGWFIYPSTSFLRTLDVYWDRSTGFKIHEVRRSRAGIVHLTLWRSDGRVQSQALRHARGAWAKRYSPPWWWGVTDQTEPSIPEWMKDNAKWQAALDAQE